MNQKTMPLEQNQLIAFNAITNFVTSLGKEFAPKQKSLALYLRLIENTTLTHEVAILKHIAAFSQFIEANQQAIENNSEEKFSVHEIVYSDKVKIDMKAIFGMADAETKSIIWKHLLTICGVIFPNSQARDVLKKMSEQKHTAETNLISEMISKIQPHLDPTETNPMNAIMGLVSSGVFTDLISTMNKGMDSGEMNVQSLLGTVTSIFSQPNPTDKLIIEEVKEN